MANCRKCGKHNILWQAIPNVEVDEIELTTVVHGSCPICNTKYQCILSGIIEAEDSSND